MDSIYLATAFNYLFNAAYFKHAMFKLNNASSMAPNVLLKATRCRKEIKREKSRKITQSTVTV